MFLPIQFQVRTFRTATQLGMDLNEAQKQRVLQLNELDEIKQDAFQTTMLVHDQIDRSHDKYIKKIVFQPGYWALLYDIKFKHSKGKFSTRWLGPYQAEEFFENGLVNIKTIDDD